MAAILISVALLYLTKHQDYDTFYNFSIIHIELPVNGDNDGLPLQDMK